MNKLQNKLNQASEFAKYQLIAKTKYGIHSPFVYDLITKVLQDKKKYPQFKKLEDERKLLLRNNEVIKINDLGAGSIAHPYSKRKIKEIAKTSLTKPKYAQLLFKLILFLKPKNIIELGTNLGLTTKYLATANQHCPIYTIEGCQELFQFSSKSFKKEGYLNVYPINGNFNDELPKLLTDLNSTSFIFIDGNHQLKPTLNYFNLCLNKINEDSVIIFDDINWSAEMKEAWNTVKSNEMVTLSIDLFQFGLVFFKERQPKQHFTVRF